MAPTVFGHLHKSDVGEIYCYKSEWYVSPYWSNKLISFIYIGKSVVSLLCSGAYTIIESGSLTLVPDQ